MEQYQANLFNELKKDETEQDLYTLLGVKLVELFDTLLSSGEVTDGEKLKKIAQLRSKVIIDLK